MPIDQETLSILVFAAGIIVAGVSYVVLDIYRSPRSDKTIREIESMPAHIEREQKKQTFTVLHGLRFGFGFGVGFFLAGIVVAISLSVVASSIAVLMLNQFVQIING